MGIEDIVDYQYAELSFRNIKRDPDISLLALRRHYIQRGINPEKDFIINGALSRAAVGIPQGHLTDNDVLRTINSFHNEYQEGLQNSTVKEILDAVAKTGYNSFPVELNKYINLTYAQLHQMAQDKGIIYEIRNGNVETTIKAIEAINVLENQKFEGQLYPLLIREKTENLLEQIYPRLEKREKQK